MYDAKEREEDQDITKANCIADRSYFYKLRSESMMNLKSGYIPSENIIE